MAPYLQEAPSNGAFDALHNVDVSSPVQNAKLEVYNTAKAVHDIPATEYYEPGRTRVQSHDDYEHTDLLPSFPDIHWDPIPEIPYRDKGLDGFEDFRELRKAATDIFDYTPKIGTEISGINLAKLTDAQKNDLARLIAVRGVVFFRAQDGFDIDAQRELGRYFGTLHKHGTTSVPRRAGLEDVHVVYTDEKSKDQRAYFTPTFLWHSDVSDWDIQPPRIELICSR